ncbi:out at first protein [Lingula anatina]|uniref:Out at first protein n=1 Tax=Lingula anatina TaxID=7574 RepID=A0A2R2MSX4_LINAN|nr:out at first protein [Lingula anatina]|eukprot:XP_023933117.1 out at first protein [Lingula anatina]
MVERDGCDRKLSKKSRRSFPCSSSIIIACLQSVFLIFLITPGCAQLVVNVKEKGGDVYKEAINANTTAETVTLEFKRSDGTFITQFIDFKNEIQIFKALVLGEEERGQNQFQVMCYITRFIKNEFISADAMSKLRQKNPGALRTPEDDKGQEKHQKDLLVDVERAEAITPHTSDICGDAKDTTYARDADLKYIAKSLNKDYAKMLTATSRPTGSVYHSPRCTLVQDLFKSCVCRYELCIGWYPCGLKYCRGKDNSGKVISYRCGIKTCKKCRMFEYYVKAKQMCLWDEEEKPVQML